MLDIIYFFLNLVCMFTVDYMSIWTFIIERFRNISSACYAEAVSGTSISKTRKNLVKYLVFISPSLHTLEGLICVNSILCLT